MDQQSRRSLGILAGLGLLYLALHHINAGGGLSATYHRTLHMLLYVVPAFLIGIVLHEWAHAYVAYRLGDPTGAQLGRLTLDPRAHLSPLGTFMIFLVGFGWANPVPINPTNFRKPRRDMALAAAAGPAMNFLICAVAILLIRLLVPSMDRDALLGMSRGGSLFLFLLGLAQMNALLGVFNLIPVAPLDGHHFLRLFLSDRAYLTYKRNEGTISVVALLLLMGGYLEPLFTAVQTGVAGMIFTQYWGV